MNKNNTKARSMVLTALVIIAIGTTILSALYVGGLVGHSQTKQQETTISTVAPGGFMLVRNATTFTPCLTSSTSVNDTTTTSNSTSTSTATCMPIGMG